MKQATIIKCKVFFFSGPDQWTESLKISLHVSKSEASSFYGLFLPTVDEIWRPPSNQLNVSISQHCRNGVIKMGTTGTARWAIVTYTFHLRLRNPRHAHGHNSF